MDVAAAQSTWTAPTVLVPLFVSLLALGGVVWANFYTAKKNRDHEDMRHRNALRAEDKRHQNSLEYHQTVRVRELRADAYVRLVTAARHAADETKIMAGFKFENFELWLPTYEKKLPALESALEELAAAVAEAEIVGSREVVEKSLALKDLTTKFQLDAFGAHFVPSNDDYRQMHLTQVRVQAGLEALRNQIRNEAGFENIPNSEP